VSSPRSSRDAATAAILRATGDLGVSHAAYGDAVAARVGLAGTDVGAVRMLDVEGAMTVGRMGELTGLTTGATTRMVDRLEQAGFVRRVADPADRRRVIVELVEPRASGILDAWAPLDAAALEVLDDLDDAGLAALERYLAACVDALRSGPGDPAAVSAQAQSAPAAVAAPIASATAGRLVFVTGAPAVKIGGAADLGAELYRASFSGAVPSARVRDGVVTIRYPRFAWFDWRARVGDQRINAQAHWRRDETEIVLNASVPWTVELRGGVSSVTADLHAVRLTRFELAGGTGSVTISLGHPTGVVPVRVAGGANDIMVVRPAGTAAVLAVKGGSRKSTLDGASAGSLGRVSSVGAEQAQDRFEIEVAGGANRVVVRTA
jgi:DNA-binding MarR family transcriptional regulator